MIRSAWATWWRVVRRRDPWITLPWIFMGGVFFTCLFRLATLSLARPRSLPSAYHVGLLVPPLVPDVKVLGVIALLPLALGGLPFVLGGLWSLYGHAVHDRVKWGTFWRLFRQSYDRGWALIAAVVLYGGVLSLFGLVLRAMAPVLTILLIPTAILSAPVMIRVVGGLFVDGLPWPQSVRRAFARGGYVTLVWGTVWAVVASAALCTGVLGALRMSGFLGASFGAMAIIFTVVAGPLWLLTLYSVTTAPVADDVWEFISTERLRTRPEVSVRDHVRRTLITGR